jgi:protein-tyrosine-phosphatase
MSKMPKKILFICYGNVARSQMAESLYNEYTHSNDAKSAGVGYSIGNRFMHPAGDVIKVMLEEGLDVSKNTVKSVTKEMVDGADKIIVMCDLDDCPRFLLDSGKVEHIPIPDPYSISIEYTRGVRDEIKRIVLDLIHSD